MILSIRPLPHSQAKVYTNISTQLATKVCNALSEEITLSTLPSILHPCDSGLSFVCSELIEKRRSEGQCVPNITRAEKVARGEVIQVDTEVLTSQGAEDRQEIMADERSLSYS